MIGWSIALALWALGTILFYWVLEHVTRHMPEERRLWDSPGRRALAVLSWPIIVAWQIWTELWRL